MKRTCGGTTLHFRTKKDRKSFIQILTTRKSFILKSDALYFSHSESDALIFFKSNSWHVFNFFISKSRFMIKHKKCKKICLHERKRIKRVFSNAICFSISDLSKKIQFKIFRVVFLYFKTWGVVFFWLRIWRYEFFLIQKLTHCEVFKSISCFIKKHKMQNMSFPRSKTK